jgi:hypothetical protein
VFFREGREKGGLLLSFSIAKRKKLLSKGISRLQARPVALSSSTAQPWTPAAFGKAAKAFDTGLVCDCLGLVPAPGVFCFFFAIIL